MKSKEELKKLFENGDKPTQENFWEWQDSYWHKDEKLPMENTGGYKIKGSLANLSALNALTDMQEGDVYNLLDTGDNYVYVLDLNNTGMAGWDILGGTISGINLQSAIDEGHIAYSSDFTTGVSFDIQGKKFDYFVSDAAGIGSTIEQSVNSLNLHYANTTNQNRSDLRLTEGLAQLKVTNSSNIESTAFNLSSQGIFIDSLNSSQNINYKIDKDGIQANTYLEPTASVDYVQKQYVDEIIASDTSYAISGINPVTQASLNTEFPNAKLGFEVYSTVNDLIYKKINNFNEWCKISISLDVEP